MRIRLNAGVRVHSYASMNALMLIYESVHSSEYLNSQV